MTRRVLAWIVLATGVLGMLGPAPASAQPLRTWIVGATVISPERQDSGRVENVLVVGDRIEAVTAVLPADAAGAATLVHAEGKFLIPGLMDSHVHLASIPAITYPMQEGHRDLVE